MHCCRECHLVQLFWRAIWRCLPESPFQKAYLHCGSYMTVLEVYPERIIISDEYRNTQHHSLAHNRQAASWLVYNKGRFCYSDMVRLSDVLPEDVHIFIPGTSECVTVQGKKNSADMTK